MMSNIQGGKLQWIGCAYVNPFTGYIHFENFTVYELQSDSIFLHTEGVNINIAMLKLLTKTYEISALTLNKPNATIIQTKRSLNFSNLIEKFSGKELADTIKSVTHFNALNIKINDGEFPESLIKAYRKMNKLNDEAPRKKFKEERKETRKTLKANS